MPLPPTHQTCPTCGGLIGATTTTSAGYPCTCFSPSADTVDEPVESELIRSKPSGPVKRCWKCGKDLRGHRRFKDSNGYWCKDCHRTDKAQHTVPESRCPDCGRMRPVDKLYLFEDVQLCAACIKERKKATVMRERRLAADQLYKSKEKRGLYVLLAVAVVLVIVVVLQRLIHHH